MWQRVQTLYLAVAAGLLCFLLFGNALTINTPDGLEAVRYTALVKPYMAIILWILAAIQLLALVSFKVRILQMRLSVVAALVSLGIGHALSHCRIRVACEVCEIERQHGKQARRHERDDAFEKCR